MDWLSFFLGFLAFPLAGACVLGAVALGRRLQSGKSPLPDAATRGSTLSFSPQLIGEIGERIEPNAGPTAKAS